MAPQTVSEPRAKHLIGKRVPFSNILFEFIKRFQQLLTQNFRIVEPKQETTISVEKHRKTIDFAVFWYARADSNRWPSA